MGRIILGSDVSDISKSPVFVSWPFC